MANVEAVFGARRACKCLKVLAPQVGLEPTTLRLTAECSTIELLRSKAGRFVIHYIKPACPVSIRRSVPPTCASAAAEVRAAAPAHAAAEPAARAAAAEPAAHAAAASAVRAA